MTQQALQRVQERNILQPIKIRKANWIGHVLHRNFLRKHITEGKKEGRIEVMGNLKGEEVDHTLSRNGF
jgi:hypothetical protein